MTRPSKRITLGAVLLLAILLCAWWLLKPKFGSGPIDIATLGDFQMDQSTGTLADVPKQIRELDGRRVTLRGEIWEPMAKGSEFMSTFDLTRHDYTKAFFVPLVQHFVRCSTKPGSRFLLFDKEVNVTGVLRIAIIKDSESNKKDRINSVFTLEVDQIQPAEN